MELAESKQYAIRRSSRLPLEVPVRVTGLNPSASLLEDCNTTVVNAHGCGLIAKRIIPRGIRVSLEIVAARRHTTALVCQVVPLGGDPETWLIGLELDTPGNFWGVEYAPSDWKVEMLPAPHRPATATQQAHRTDKAQRSWRLTDISTGACYLTTVDPFAEGIRVVVSIRTSDAEYLVDGIVRTSHAQAGMGVEFTVPEQRTRIGDLIARLTSTGEVPRVSVRRNDGQQKQRDPRGAQPQTDQAIPDSLTELVRQGPALSSEQFFCHLRAQRLGKQRNPRG
jgi:hypothetical protein